MKLSIHAIDQLNDRYAKWGLNVPEAISIIESTIFEAPEIYRMIILDDIPIVLICDFNEVITIYPHPVDAAESWLELIETIKSLRQTKKNLKKALNISNGYNDLKDKYIKKIEQQNKHWKQKMRGVWK